MDYYHILDELPDEHPLPSVPTQLWLLLTLEVVISDSHGESLLLTYPSYSLEGMDDHVATAEGYWTPPFLGYPVELGFEAPDTVGAVKAFFQRQERGLDLKKAIGELAYIMGLPNPQLSNTGSFIELKRSPRTPDLWKCYKIVRFACLSLGPRGRRNLADPECRKGYVFLPLEEMHKLLTTCHSAKHHRTERLYLSKPLISNLDHVLSSAERIARLKANAIPLDSKQFRLEEEGLIICADLAGYGAACKYATDKMHSFVDEGTTIATYFRESVAGLFYRFLARVGAAQTHTAGDGFIAAIPTRHMADGDVGVALKAFLDTYRLMLGEVEKFNRAIQDKSKIIGSRLALHYGDYHYGRIALSRSISADFDGASIIEVARLEGALREYTKGSIQQHHDMGERSVAKLAHSHMLICTERLESATGGALDRYSGLDFRTEIPIRIKEFESTARVFEIRV